MTKPKWYVVWVGKKPGVYNTWVECKKQVNGFKEAVFKSFDNEDAAKKAFRGAPAYKKNAIGKFEKKRVYEKRRFGKESGLIKDEAVLQINPKSICVDASCVDGIGEMEYRGVWKSNRKVIFSSKKFPRGTSNIGEFLAIVEAMRYLESVNNSLIIYSDSDTAIRWVKAKKANTKLIEDAKTKELWKLIREAEQYLKETTFSTMVLKWDSNTFGENPADYGRKKMRRKNFTA